MQHLTATPFGHRMLSHADLQRREVQPPLPQGLSADKWQILEHLRVLRKEMGLNDRTLTVLQALLSFHPHRELQADGHLIVWPSNASLSERANGIPESTLRRHLATLTKSGLIQRHDSPNGKRYARRSHFGSGTLAFGFCLRPLLVQAPALAEAAHRAQQQDIMRKDLRTAISLILRDAEAYALQDNNLEAQVQIAELKKSLRRQQPLADLEQLHHEASVLITRDVTLPACSVAPQMSGSDSQNERHIQVSIKEYKNKTLEKAVYTSSNVVTQFPALKAFENGPVTKWEDLYELCGRLAPMLGLNPQLVEGAKSILGLDGFSVTIAAMLERVDRIKSPNAYLNHLLSKAKKQLFQPFALLKPRVDSCQLSVAV